MCIYFWLFHVRKKSVVIFRDTLFTNMRNSSGNLRFVHTSSFLLFSGSTQTCAPCWNVPKGLVGRSP